jgi:hypothetical protein
VITHIVFQFSKEFGGNNESELEEQINSFISEAALGIAPERVNLDVVNERVVCTEPSD